MCVTKNVLDKGTTINLNNFSTAGRNPIGFFCCSTRKRLYMYYWDFIVILYNHIFSKFYKSTSKQFSEVERFVSDLLSESF